MRDRTAEGLPTRVKSIDVADGRKKIGDFSYAADWQIIKVTNAQTGETVYTSKRSFGADGELKVAQYIYPRYWYSYVYDERGVATRIDKFDGQVRFSESFPDHDEFLNKTGQDTHCLTLACEPKDLRDFFERGENVRSIGTMNNGERREWRRTFDAGHSMKTSELTVNGRFVVRFVVTKNGSAVSTEAFAPDGRKIFVYPDNAVDNIHANGLPIDAIDTKS